MSWLQMSLSPLTRWTGPFLTVPWGGLVFRAGSGRRTLLIIVRFAYGSSLLLVYVNFGVEMGVSLRAVLLSMVFIVALYVPWCRYLESLLDVRPQV